MDLNLVRCFIAVYESGSVTAAAARLHVTQPAVSQALSRLRSELDDVLFFRSGKSMHPTALSTSLYPPLSGGLSTIDGAIDRVREFDPGTSTSRFRIALSELGELTFLPLVLARLRTVAPGVALDIRPLDAERLGGWLSDGSVDLAITSSPVDGNFESSIIRSQPYSVVMSSDHALAQRKTLSVEEYLSAEHVIVAGDSAHPSLSAAISKIGTLAIPLRLNHFSGLPALLSTGNRIATVPANLAAIWSHQRRLVARDVPFAMSPMEIRIYRRVAGVHSTALDWLLTTVLDACVAADAADVKMASLPSKI